MVGSESSLPLVILALTGKFFVAVTLTAGNQLTFEMIPTVLRAQGGAMATSLGMALSFCAPYIAYSVSRIHSLRLIKSIFLPQIGRLTHH